MSRNVDRIARVAVIVPAHNEEELLPGCLRAIHQAVRAAQVPTEILVVGRRTQNADIRRHADRLAGGGYLALAPDLLEGKSWLRCIRSMFRQIRGGLAFGRDMAL